MFILEVRVYTVCILQLMKKIILLFIFLSASQAYAQTHVVEEILSDDTLRLSNGETVELIGIDRPEEALSLFNEYMGTSLYYGNKVYLEYDVKKKSEKGSTLAYVYIKDIGEIFKPYSPRDLQKVVLTDDKKDLFLNASLIKAGIVLHALNRPNLKYKEMFSELQKEAKKTGIGIWKARNKKEEELEKK